MTGTGTKADPYIVFTWDELLSTVVQEDVFVELGADIDCKELGAITIENSYEFRCFLEGNGYSIKNLYLYHSSSVFYFSKNHPISNLTFKNIYMDNVYALFQFKSDHPLYYYLPTFINCHFSAELVNRSNFIDNITTHLYCAVFRGCTFHILCKDSQFTGVSPYADNRRPILLDNCVLEIYGTSQDSVFSAQLVNSYVTGEVTLTRIAEYNHDPAIEIVSVGCFEYYSGQFMKSNSIVDLIVHNETGEASIPYIVYDNAEYTDDITGDYVDTTTTLFVNTEVLEDFERDTGYQGTFHACTSAQIHDETYLRSEGFIAEEIFSSRYVTKHSLNTDKYITSNAAYINTGVINTSGVKIMSEFEFSSASGAFSIGGYDSDGYGVAHGTGNGQNIDDLETIRVNISGDYYYGLVGTKFHCYTPGTTWWGTQNEFPMIINGQNYGGTKRYGMDGKIYHVSIWDSNSTLIRDYYPAYDNVTHEYGMYDKVAQVFHSSDTDTPFDSGDEMPFKFVDGELQHNKANNLIRLGAFINATSLSQIEIPESVKHIGKYAFTNTALSSVTIASDCEYYGTSFPDGCVINTY